MNKKWNSFKRYFWPVLFIVFDLLIALTIVIVMYYFAYWQPTSKKGSNLNNVVLPAPLTPTTPTLS